MLSDAGVVCAWDQGTPGELWLTTSAKNDRVMCTCVERSLHGCALGNGTRLLNSGLDQEMRLIGS